MQLDEGQFMGDIIKNWELNDFTLTLTRHESHATVPHHVHHYPYLSLLLSGHYKECSQVTHADISPGDVLYRPAGYEHQNEVGYLEGYCFNLEIKKDLFTGQLKSKSEDFVSFTSSGVEWSKIYMLCQNDTAPEILNITIEEHIIQLFFQFYTYSTIGNAHWIPGIKRYVLNNLHETFSIAKVANLASVHPNYFVRKFKQKTGHTFGAYLLNTRLQRALDLMINSNKSLTEICLETGFCDQSHFIRCFKSELQITPSAYRKLLKSVIVQTA